VGEEDPSTVNTMMSLASLLWDQDRLDEAEPLIRRTLEIRKRVLGVEDKATVSAELSVAALLEERGEFSEAESIKRRLLDVGRRLDDEDSWWTRSLVAELATSLVAQGKLDESSSLYGNKRMPESLGIEKWIQGGANPGQARVTFLIFWEEWCPYSHKALPGLREAYDNHKDRGLEMILLTEITLSSTEEKVVDCIGKNRLTFPVAKVGKETMAHFGARSWPSTVILVDGRMVWRGHPDDLTDQVYASLLGLSGDEISSTSTIPGY